MFCRNCHREFSEKSTSTACERGEAWGIPYVVSYVCCPYCGSDDITNEYHHCDCCGDVCEHYIETEDGRRYCENCYTVKR